MASRTCCSPRRSGPRRVTPAEVVAVLEGDGGAALGEFLRRQRWFAAKARGLDAVRIEDWAVLDQRATRCCWRCSTWMASGTICRWRCRHRPTTATRSPGSGHGWSSRATPIRRSGGAMLEAISARPRDHRPGGELSLSADDALGRSGWPGRDGDRRAAALGGAEQYLDRARPGADPEIPQAPAPRRQPRDRDHAVPHRAGLPACPSARRMDGLCRSGRRDRHPLRAAGLRRQ